MSKKTLVKFEDWKAPWEVDSSGNPIPDDDQQVDPARLKKHLYNLESDKVRLQEQIDVVSTERDTVKTDLETALRKGEGEDEKTVRERNEALAAAEKKGALAALKLEVALDIDGITPAQAKRLAKRLTGETQEELQEDAKAIAEDFGIGKAPETGGDEGDESFTPSARPRRPRASGDPDPDAKVLPPPTVENIDKLFPRR